MTLTRKLVAATFAFALVAAACGDDDDSTTTTQAPPATGGGEDAGLAAAKAVVEANLTPPEKIGPTIPLTAKPPAKTVAWLECSLPSCQAIGRGFKEATALLGWKLEVISWSTDPVAAFQQALDTGVDYVAITGTQPELIQAQIDEAKSRGIAFFSCFDTADPKQEENNIWVQCGDDDAVTRAGDLIANAIIADSEGKANVVMVNIPDFAVLVNEREGSKAAYAKNCPGCKFDELALTLDQLLTGEVPGAVVSYLQAHPDVNYVHFAFDGLTGGVSTALADAGLLQGRKLVGVDYSGAVLQEIVEGKHAFWTTNPKEYSAWIMIDGMARHALGMDNPEERANALLPTFIVNSAEMAQPLIASDGWPGPATMAEQFAALWQVG